MMTLVRRVLLAILLFSLLFIFNSLNQSFADNFYTLIIFKLGLFILLSFVFGEIALFLGVPKLVGYLLSGILFGQYSFNIFPSEIFTIISKKDIGILNPFFVLSFAFIAFSAGFELDFSFFRKKLGSIVRLTSYKLILLVISFTAALFTFWHLIPQLHSFTLFQIVIGAIILSLISLSTSFELTLGTVNETGINDDLRKFIFNTTAVKNIISVLGLVVILSVIPISSDKSFASSALLNLFFRFITSVITGIAGGFLISLYVKHIKKEIFLVQTGFIIILSQLSIFLDLDILIVFLSAGYFFKVYSGYNEIFTHSLKKISLPVYITFFSLLAASFNLGDFTSVLLVVSVLTVLRIAAFLTSPFLAIKKHKYNQLLRNYSGISFLPVSAIILGAAEMLRTNNSVQGEFLSSVFAGFFLTNAFIGPILQAIFFKKSIEFEPDITEPDVTTAKPEEKSEIQKEAVKVYAKSKFTEPAFEDQGLNESLYSIMIKLNQILTKFDGKFIHRRSEESIEMLLTITEKYSDDFQKLRQIFLSEKKDFREINQAILSIKKQFIESFVSLFDERKSSEKNILVLEELLKELYYALSDLTDSLPERYKIPLEETHKLIRKDDSVRSRLIKHIKSIERQTRKFLRIPKKEFREFPYRNMAKYFLLGQTSNEIRETVNLVGLERLTTLRQLRRLFNDYCNHIDNMLLFAIEEKNNFALNMLMLEKFDEIHNEFVNEIQVYTKEVNNTTNEISRRFHYSLTTPYNKFLEMLSLAGTHSLNNSKYQYSKIYRKSEEERELTLESIRFWINYYIGLIGLSQKEGYNELLKTELNILSHESLVSVSEEINSTLRNITSKTNKDIITFEKNFQSKSTEELLNNAILPGKFRSDILADLEESIKSLEKIRKSSGFQHLITNLLANIKLRTNSLPSGLSLLDEKQILFDQRNPTFVELKSFEIRNITNNLLSKLLPREFGELNELLINHLNFTLVELKNYYAVINYHLNTIEEELKNNSEQSALMAKEIALSLKEKTANKINIINTHLDKLENNINNKIIERVNRTISFMEEDLYSGKLNNIVSRSLENEKISIAGFIKPLQSVLFYNFRKTLLRIKLLNKKVFNPVLKELLSFSGIKIRNMQTAFSANLLSVEEKLSKLPFIYRKLFDGSPLDSIDYFVDSELFKTKIDLSLNNFYNNKECSLLVCGEPGSGKSSLMYLIKNHYLGDVEYINHIFNSTINKKQELIQLLCYLLNLPQRSNVEEIIFALNDRSKKRIILFENIGKTFLRTIDGYECVKLLIHIISRTNKNSLWICSIGKQPYDFLVNSFMFDKPFKFKILTQDLHKRDLKTILLQRHNTTGYNLKFIPDEYTELKYRLFKIKSASEKQKLLEINYFENLEEYAQGNILSGMFYWLISIDSVKENEIILKSPRNIQIEAFNHLSAIHFQVLAVLMNHSWLTDSEVAKVLNINFNKCKEILDYLASLNLIYLDQLEIKSNKYFINKFVYKPIYTELINKNYLSL